MPVLRRSHDHHQDLRARLRAQAPPHTGTGADQARHIMRPAPPINDRSDERHSGRLSADSAHARIGVRDSPPVAPPILSRHAQNARSYRRTRLRVAEARPSQPLRSSLLKPEPAAKSPSARCSAAPYLPRFRALALFRRRPQVREDSFVIPASENLHKSGSRRRECGAVQFSKRGR
jgi:hypothetical protein